MIKPRKDWNAAVYGVGNDNPQAIVQRNKLKAAANLKDAIGKDLNPAASNVPPAAANNPAPIETQPATQPAAPPPAQPAPPRGRVQQEDLPLSSPVQSQPK